MDGFEEEKKEAEERGLRRKSVQAEGNERDTGSDKLRGFADGRERH